MKSLKLYSFVFLIVILGNGCKKLIDVGAPPNQLISENVYATDATAIAALTSIYSKMVTSNNFPYKISMYTGIAGDEQVNYSTLYAPLALNALNPIDATTNDIWKTAYQSIYQSNAVIEGCSNSPRLSSNVKKQLIAEATFVRAFWYFYLVNLYGNVPLVLTTDYSKNAALSRASTSNVYEQIIADLISAQNSLNENYVNANSISTSNERIRPNKAAATALLARTYLYVGNYPAAEEQATLLINNSIVYALDPLEKVFLSNSKEAIWQLKMPDPTYEFNTYEGAYYLLNGRPTAEGQNSSSLRPQLLQEFGNDDKRKRAWIGITTDQTITPHVNYYYPSKYKVISSSTITENSTVLRIAEQYLIRAEARAQQGNLDGAIEDIDKIRGRAGISLIRDTNPNINKESLLTLILTERQKELFAEWGHRWLDLKRTKKIDEVMNIVAPTKETTWDTRMQLWPIPQTEIQNNPNLGPNNSGYN